MTDAPAQVVETPEAPPAPSSSSVLASLTSDQRDTWLKTGALPDAAPAPEGDGSTAEPEVTTAGTETAEVTTAIDAPAQTGKPRNDIKARMGQLAEQKRLEAARADKAERELAELRAAQNTGTAPSAPATQATPVQTPHEPAQPSYLDLVKRYQGAPDWPTLDQATEQGFDDPYGATMAAQAAYIQNAQHSEREQHHAIQAQRTREQQNIDKAFAEARKIAGFKESALDIPVTPDFAKAIFESDLSGQLLYYFSENPAEGRKIAAMDAVTAARAIGRLEATFESHSSPVVSSTPATQKTVSSAPAPTLTLGAKHTNGSVDEVEAALQAGDTSRYIEAANKREVAAMRSGRR